MIYILLDNFTPRCTKEVIHKIKMAMRPGGYEIEACQDDSNYKLLNMPNTNRYLF